MTLTVYGTASGTNEISCHRNRYGHVTGAHAFDDISPELPDNGVPVDLGHDPTNIIGKMVYGEITEQGALNIVTVLDGDELTRITEPVFFSPLMTHAGAMRHRHHVAPMVWLESVALTFDTARVGVQPVAWMRGDIRSQPDRARWPMSWRSEHPLLQRALDTIGDSCTARTAPGLFDRRASLDTPPPGTGWHDYAGRPSRGPSAHTTGYVIGVH
jgi:hypothetical protein